MEQRRSILAHLGLGIARFLSYRNSMGQTPTCSMVLCLVKNSAKETIIYLFICLFFIRTGRYVYIYIYVCIYIYIYTCVCIYIYAYLHICPYLPKLSNCILGICEHRPLRASARFGQLGQVWWRLSAPVFGSRATCDDESSI